jgi:hypothetical protein
MWLWSAQRFWRSSLGTIASWWSFGTGSNAGRAVLRGQATDEATRLLPWHRPIAERMEFFPCLSMVNVHSGRLSKIS